MKRCSRCPALVEQSGLCHACELADRGDRQVRMGFRATVLARDGYVCQGCGLSDPTGRVLVVDHVVPLASGGASLDVANGQTLCADCSATKTRSEVARRL